MLRCIFCFMLFIAPLVAALAPVQAETLAIFPIEDLSKGGNGVNYEVSNYLAWEMNQRGYDVIADEELIAFMARHRMRWLGFLDTSNIVSAQEELGADLILFGTVSTRQESLSPSLGLTLYLVRTSDTRTIWTGNAGLSAQDIINILGINEKSEKEGLMAKLTQNVLQSWPEDLNLIASQQQPLEIAGYSLTPEHVQRGDEVFCNVTLRNKWSDEDMPRIFFKAAGRVYRAVYSAASQKYNSEWIVADKDGRYPVTMVVNWPSGRKKVAYIGSYRVDSTPPRLVLDLKGVQLQGTVAFRDKIIIVPRMLRREPVARWKLRVDDDMGEEQMSTYGYGNLPMRFVWNGLGRDGWPAEEGIYKISLQVWDRADNVAEAVEPVAVARTPPTMVLEAKNRGRDMIVDLSHEGNVPVAFWRIEMRGDDGSVIKVAEGEELPVRIDLNRPTRRTIKVAEELRSPGKTIKVADQLRPPSKTIKVAERLQPPRKSTTIKVAAADSPLQIDGLRPEDKDKRKVSATVIIRDILGNIRKEKVDNLYDYFPEQKNNQEVETITAPVWLESF
ncbi:MAG: hypothetical protein ABFS18_06355 [Thermodesulfobacteriota bacterium]